MHIVYISSEFVTERNAGGLATYLNNVSGIMSKHSHKVTIITLSDKNDKFKFRDNVDVIRVKKKCANSGVNIFEDNINRLVNSFRIKGCLDRLMREEKVDIVQTANYQAVGFFRSYRVPTIVRASSDSAMWRNAGYDSFDFEKTIREIKLEDWMELWCIKHADFAFAPSKFCAEVLTKRAKAKVAVIESPYQRKDINTDDSLYREKLQDKKYILFNSSLSYLKGTHMGIEATDVLLEKYPDLYIVYAGSDYGLKQDNGRVQSVAEVLRRQNKKYDGRVIYLGKLKQEYLFPVVQNALACILPSRVDNLPNSCIEAMTMGKIVVGTYGASFEQLIANKESGLLIKRDSSKALVKAIDYLMRLTPYERESMGERARGVTERLNPEDIYNQLIQLYYKTIKEFKD